MINRLKKEVMIMKADKWIEVLILFMTAAFVAPLVSGAIEAGAAARDYTPPVDEMRVPLGGYGDRMGKPSTGVHDPVFIKALALMDDQNMVVIATMDIVGIPKLVRDKVIEKLSGIGLRDDNFLITASHSHSAPEGMDKNFVRAIIFGRYNDELAERTADLAAEAVRDAVNSLQPASISIAQGEVKDLTRNRRDPSYNYDTRRFTDAYDPQNPLNVTDDTMTVVRVDDDSGNPIAVLVHFATHPTVLGSDNFLVSADWPGVMQRELEESYPGTVVMYMNGAQGDQAPAMDVAPEIDDFEWLERIGGRAAEVAKPLIESTKPVKAEPLISIMERREINAKAQAMGITLPRFLVQHWFEAMPLMVVRAGDIAFLGAPLEMISKMGHTIQESAGAYVEYPLVAGLSNGLWLYCATPDEFERGGYEVGNTMFGKIEAGLVIGELMMLMDKVD
jgi:neutral ceramidase